MQVILLERIEKLGAPGSEVSVKRGYARNWLLPQGKAVLATAENRQRAQKEQAQIDARDQAKKAEALSVQQTLDGKEVILVRAAGESGHLYGSVRTQDIAEAIGQQLQIIISKKFVTLEEPVRSTGIFSVPVRLHPEVPVAVNINVAPSEDEAKRQALKRDQARQKKEQGESHKKSRQESGKESGKGRKSAKKTEEERTEEGRTEEGRTEEGRTEAESSEAKSSEEAAQATQDEDGNESQTKSKKEAKKTAEEDSEEEDSTSAEKSSKSDKTEKD